MVESIRDDAASPAPKRRAPVRKWTQKEDETLRSGVLSYVARNLTPKFSEICKKLPHRSVKQAKERWKNSLNPEITKGQWTTKEMIQLLDLIIEKGENWTEIQQVLSHRSMHCIKSKGRKLLGESISKKLKRICKGMLNKSWTEEERKKLLDLHLKFQYDMECICLHLGTGKSMAQTHRELITTCNCASCTKKLGELKSMNMDFKLAWAISRAIELRNELAASVKMEEPGYTLPKTHPHKKVVVQGACKTKSETSLIPNCVRKEVVERNVTGLKPVSDVYLNVMKDAEMAQQRFSQKKRQREYDICFEVDISKKLRPLGWNEFDAEKDILDGELDFSDEDVLDDLLISLDNEPSLTSNDVTQAKAPRRQSVISAWRCLNNQVISVN